MNDEFKVHRQIECDIQGLHEHVTAVGIPAEVRLAYTGDDIGIAQLFGQNRGKGQEQQVTSIHERAWQLPFFPCFNRNVIPR
ncbi:hypothetical protein D3C72_2411830 [compost metagenome]